MTPASELLDASLWPSDFFQTDSLSTLLDSVYVVDYTSFVTAGGLSINLRIVFEGELKISLPGLDAVSVVFGVPRATSSTSENGAEETNTSETGEEQQGDPDEDFVYATNLSEGWTELALGLQLSDDGWQIALQDVTFQLRFDDSLLQPAEGSSSVAITMRGNVVIDDSLDLNYDGFDSFDLPPCEIGNTGIGLAAQGVRLSLSRTTTPDEVLAAGLEEGFFGFYFDSARVTLPESINVGIGELDVEAGSFGTGGFSGRVSSPWDITVKKEDASYSLEGDAVGTLFGFPFGLERVGLEFKQNTLTASEISGVLVLPFFDAPVRVDLGLSTSGDFAVSLAADQLEDQVEGVSRGEDGLLVLEKEGLLRLTLESLSFQSQEGDFLLTLSGSVQPLFRESEIDWPEVEIKGLMIDSDGKVTIDGGWIDLPSVQPLDFYGFSVELERIGFGQEEDGSRWIGFSGGINLVDGVPMGASVEGLKIIWNSEIRLELSGIGVSFTIPDTLSFSGEVAFLDEEDKGFAGAVRLNLMALNMELDAQLLIARDVSAGYSTLYVYLSTDLPSGIPLFQTGQAIYGFAGLFGYNRKPTKDDAEDWYGNDTGGWYKDSPTGVTSLEKWMSSQGDYAFGAGVTLGTLPDGYPFSAKVLLVVLVPGPVLLIEGKAQFLRKRYELSESDPPFAALAILDLSAGYFLFNVEAEYKFPGEHSWLPEGLVLDIETGAEAYFNLSDLSAWHLYLGEKEDRIRAAVLSLFEANAYFMLDSTSVAMGAWVGYDREWDFGVLAVGLEAWMDGNALVSWKPAQFWADLWLQGGVYLSACGVSVGLSVGAGVEMKTPTPYYLGAELEVSLNLPWPLPDPEAKIRLVWEQEEEPATPLPLHNIAVEHLKVSEKWPLETYPDLALASDPDFYDESKSTSFSERPSYYEDDASPTVPLDAKVVINFAKPMNAESEVIGDPASADKEKVGDYYFRYELTEVELERLPKDGSSSDWIPVPDPGDASDERELWGEWQLNGGGDPNTCLMLYSLTPFEYARETTDQEGWSETIIASLKNYPCNYDTEPDKVCVDFEDLEPGTEMPLVFARDDVVFVGPTVLTVVANAAPRGGTERALSVRPDQQQQPLTIYMPEPVTEVYVAVHVGHSLVTIRAYGSGSPIAEETSSPGLKEVTLSGSDERPIEWVEVIGDDYLLLKVCYVTQLEQQRAELNLQRIEHLAQTTEAHWQGEAQLLDPETYYRVTVSTKVTVTSPDGSEKEFPFTQYAYFQTALPPGCFTPSEDSKSSLDPSAGSNSYPEGGPLKDLTGYVALTIPEAGEAYHYRGYDVGIEFNESYVEQMYLMADLPLGIRLYDNNGDPLTDSEGNPVELENAWGDNPVKTTTTAEAEYASLMTRTGCAVITLDILPADDSLGGTMPENVLLRARTNYLALLMAGDYAVYQFAFTSSQFANFVHHVHSFKDILWDYYELSGKPVEPLLSEESLTELKSRVESLRSSSLENRVEAYEQISDLFSLGFRTLPQALEITHLRDKSQSYGLLLESPEPLDWERIQLSIAYSSDPTQLGTMVVGPLKGIGATIDPEGKDRPGNYNKEWIDVLLTEDAELNGYQIQHTINPGTSEEAFQEYYTFGDEGKLAAGTVIRIHSGAEADHTDPEAGVVHRYVADEGEVGNWRLNNEGDTIQILDGNGAIVHIRSFLPSSSFGSELDFVAVPSEDGTRAFVFLCSEADPLQEFTPGRYRLSFSFQLDIGPDALILKKDGSSEPEEATIEFVVESPD